LLYILSSICQLKGFEFIKAIHLDPLPFDIERDLITPTYKKKRPQMLKYYQVRCQQNTIITSPPTKKQMYLLIFFIYRRGRHRRGRGGKETGRASGEGVMRRRALASSSLSPVEKEERGA